MNRPPYNRSEPDGGQGAEVTSRPSPEFSRPLTESGENLSSFESQLRMAERLAAYGQLAAEAVHEISNLATIILFNVELQRESQQSLGQVDKFVDPIHRASRLVAGLCRQLRDLSHLMPRELRVMDLGKAVRQIYDLVEQVVGRDLSLQCETESPLWVLADPSLINQMVVNLVLNGRDATDEESGRLEVRVGRVADKGEHQDWRFVDVIDNGHGMTPQVRAQLFQPFFTTKPLGHGTGLGLVTVQRMVEELHGRIELKSEVAHGAHFRILLPPAEEPLGEEEDLADDLPLAEGDSAWTTRS